jgi:polyisoprenyl-phosphate glycosyltransferase
MKNNKDSFISVVVPVYNEEQLILKTVNSLLSEVSNWNHDYEIIFVNDGSSDDTFKILEKEALKNSKIKIINFSRNFGHQMAFTAGLDYSKGNAVIVIDGDLQDPPRVMRKFISLWEQGYHVVYGRRVNRKGESYFKLASAKIFYRILNMLSNIKIPKDTGDFRLMDRSVVNKLNLMREKHRFIRGMVTWVGFNQTFVEYDRDERSAGETKYPLKKMISFAFDGIFSFSTVPIRLTISVGIFAVFISMLGIIFAFVSRILTNGWVSGWTTIIISILFLGGVQLVSIGVLGQYIGRTFEEIKDRPLYIVQDMINMNEERPLN